MFGRLRVIPSNGTSLCPKYSYNGSYEHGMYGLSASTGFPPRRTLRLSLPAGRTLPIWLMNSSRVWAIPGSLHQHMHHWMNLYMGPPLLHPNTHKMRKPSKRIQLNCKHKTLNIMSIQGRVLPSIQLASHITRAIHHSSFYLAHSRKPDMKFQI